MALVDLIDTEEKRWLWKAFEAGALAGSTWTVKAEEDKQEVNDEYLKETKVFIEKKFKVLLNQYEERRDNE